MAYSQLMKVREFLSCAICYYTFTDPCTLNCQHTFCRKCITQYICTRPEIVRSKAIPCPSCRQKTKVPSPTKPMEEWAGQIKPSIIILGLLETSPSCDDVDQCCLVCEHLGETTPASVWCRECEMTLCERCTTAHSLNAGSYNHEVCKLSDDIRLKKRHKLMCQEHEKNVEFHCNDCNKPACQSCCALNHRACHSVVTIESLKENMKSELMKTRCGVSVQLEQTSEEASRIRDAIMEASQRKNCLKTEIQLYSNAIVDRIREQEKQLIDKLDQASRTQTSQLRAELKTQTDQIQTYKQQCEFIAQAVDDDSSIRMYEVYHLCQYGALLTEPAKDSLSTKRRCIEDIAFKPNLAESRNVLELGEICVTYQTETGPETGTLSETETDLMSDPVMCNVIETRLAGERNTPDLIDIAVLDANGKQVLVVTDWEDDCLKSFYSCNHQLHSSKLSLGKRPSGLAHFQHQVMVTVLGTRQIVTVDVRPELVQTSSMITQKMYMSLAVINSSSLAAGSSRPTPCVDVLNMTGHIIMSISTFNNEELFKKPVYLSMSRGNIVVSDWDKKCVTCLAVTGEVLWQYSPSDSRALKRAYGVTTSRRGEVLLVDRDADKVILLSEKGEFVRDVLTRRDGIDKPRGIFYDDKRGCLFVSEENALNVKEFIFGISI